MSSAADYLKLVTGEHDDKPSFLATLTTLVQGFSDTNNTEGSFPSVFDLDLAVGPQLDSVGLWVGISRLLKTPITGVYFSWDGTTSVGWDSGSWQGPYDPSTGLSSLPDDAYRLLLKTKIAANNWDSTIPGAIAIYAIIFNGKRTVIIQDNQDMSFTLGFLGPPLSAIELALLTGGYIPLKPSGVRISEFALPSDVGPMFAWETNNTSLAGWDAGQWAIELQPS